MIARLVPWAAWVVPFGVYVASLDGAVSYWDTGEAQVVPWIFGIAHPTGFPAFVIAAGFFAHLFPFGPVAWRIALFSAIAMSLAALAVYRGLRELQCDRWIALGSAWAFAFGEIAWTRGTRAEVHALAACLGAFTLYFAIRWYVRSDRRAFVFGALCWGLGIATHPIDALLAPALAVLLLAAFRRVTLRTFAAAMLVFACALSLYAYLPIRSEMVTQAHLDPTRSLGIAPGKAFWDTDHPASWDGFKHFLSGSDYGAGVAFAAVLQPATYRDGAPPFFADLWREWTAFGILLAIIGLVALARNRQWLAAALFLAGACPAIFAFSYPIEADIGRYYLLPFVAVALLAGYGAEAAARGIPDLRAISRFVMPAIAVALLVVNRNTFLQPRYTGAQTLIQTVLAHTPGDAVLLAPWIDSTPLAYAAYVDRALGKRIVDSAWLSDEAARVPQWIAQGRHVYVVDQVYGDVPGYRLVRIPGSPDVYRIEKK